MSEPKTKRKHAIQHGKRRKRPSRSIECSWKIFFLVVFRVIYYVIFIYFYSSLNLESFGTFQNYLETNNIGEPEPQPIDRGGSTDRSAQQEDHEHKPEEAPIDRVKLADRSRQAPIVRHNPPNVRARVSETGQRQRRSIAQMLPIDRAYARKQSSFYFTRFLLIFLVFFELFWDISEFQLF